MFVYAKADAIKPPREFYKAVQCAVRTPGENGITRTSHKKRNFRTQLHALPKQCGEMIGESSIIKTSNYFRSASYMHSFQHTCLKSRSSNFLLRSHFISTGVCARQLPFERRLGLCEMQFSRHTHCQYRTAAKLKLAVSTF